MLTVIDEFTRRCMAVVVERRLNLAYPVYTHTH